MPFVFDISLLLGGLITILLSLIAYFIKQLHTDFKRVERDLVEVKTTTQIIKSEFRSDFQVLAQRVEFMETRIKNLEKFKS
jgi:cell division protein FtsB